MDYSDAVSLLSLSLPLSSCLAFYWFRYLTTLLLLFGIWAAGVVSNVKLICITRCPECGKVFSSTAALVAHMEQVRNRCRIRDTKDFARIMGDVTGGLVQIRGELPHGGDRIIARQIVEPMLPQHGAGL